jgi:hypothetical protein
MASFRPRKKRIRAHHGHGACRVCGWRIARGGLDRCCVSCARQNGILPPFPPHYRKLAAAAQATQEQRIRPEWQQPRPPIPRVIEGREYLVMWDGS